MWLGKEGVHLGDTQRRTKQLKRATSGKGNHHAKLTSKTSAPVLQGHGRSTMTG